MTKITKATADKILVGGWNCALNNVHSWIQLQLNDGDLSRKQKILLLELEQELNSMENLWRGRQADD
jgi:hypothetical protein